MTIFSPRTIKLMLNENAKFLTEEQLDQHVSKFNREDFQSIDTEWEVAVLNAFSKIGEVQHHPDLGGTARLDLLFVPERDTKARLAADIGTVSDKGFENENPIKAYDVELRNRLGKTGLRVDSFGYSIEPRLPTRYGDKKKLMLPPRDEFNEEIFDKKFNLFLNQIRRKRDKPFTHQISTAKTSIRITYNPDQRGFTASWSKYDPMLKSKTKNPVYNALKSKAQKFKKTSYNGPKGIILCDGGSDMFSSQPRGSFQFDHGAPDTIKEFLRQNQSIDFVLMLSSVWTHGRTGVFHRYYRGPIRKIQVEVFPNKNFNTMPISIRDVLSELERHFPEPINVASGARETIRYGFDPKKFRPFAGGFTVIRKEIKISASAVLGLLAGVVTQEELFKALKFWPWDNSSPFPNPFKDFLNQKMRIVEIEVKDTPYDDSNLIFKFDGPDPAISPFVNPKTK